MKIKCPICNEELVKIDNVYRCLNRHNYDIAKEGYINLLRKQGGKDFGDSPDMVKARRAFFSKDYYHPLKIKLTELIKNYSPSSILDLGSGEGYYTNYFKDKIDADIVGIDIAKEAVRIASKQNRNVNYIVGSVQDIPLFDKSVDLVINNFTPLDVNEITRVLGKNGILITTKVGKNHLIELKQAIYDEVYLNDNEPIKDDRLELLDSLVISFNIELDSNEDIVNLFMMTPYSHHTSLESKEKLKTLDKLSVTCEFNIDIYKKQTLY
ncbi:MAG: methyltransferase domain-containing protein [Erysipelotrichaceae bacterium]|nr:methyltransferase domain-containing protein [Erysipelotrichaceae bacterium]